jgi:hypothetical protein
MILVLLSIWACFDQEEPINNSYEPWPTELKQLAKRCGEETRLASLCWIEATLMASEQEDFTQGEMYCEKITGFWNDECYFQLAKQSIKKGYQNPALQYCIQSDRFKRNCITHITKKILDHGKSRAHQKLLRKNIAIWDKFDDTISTIKNKTNKDLMLLKLALEDPKYTLELCKRIESIEIRSVLQDNRCAK